MAEIMLHDGVGEVLLRSYEYGWELCWKKRRTDKDTNMVEEYWCAGKWYATLPQALNGLTEFKLRNSEATDMVSLTEAVNKIYNELKGITDAYK